MSDLAMTIKRLTLECGHLRLSGPWDTAYVDGEPRHMIGDITFCEVCPRVHRAAGDPTGPGMEMAVRQVVNVEPVPGDQYREPGDAVARRRMDVLHG